jgi:hypothetical protein
MEGGTGGSAPDAKNCPTVAQTGDFPCDVFAVVHSVCNKCHTNPTKNGAPFPLLTYADTQQPFPALLGTTCTTDADCGPTPGNCVMPGGFCKGRPPRLPADAVRRGDAPRTRVLDAPRLARQVRAARARGHGVRLPGERVQLIDRGVMR